MAAPPADTELLVGAQFAVRSLEYLGRLDAAMMPKPESRPFEFDSEIVDIAHARWAAGTAITAIDLCAAVIGRRHARGYPKGLWGLEMDLYEARRDSAVKAHPKCTQWVRDVWADDDYQMLLGARNAFIHRHVDRHGTLTIIVPPQPRRIVAILRRLARRPLRYIAIPGRTHLNVLLRDNPKAREVSVPELISTAHEVALRHVTAFRTAVSGGGI